MRGVAGERTRSGDFRLRAHLRAAEDSTLRRWGGRLAVVLGVAVCGVVVCYPLTATDIWWHLAAGREILVSGAPPSTDSFSISAQGKAWTDLHWLFQLGSVLVHSAGGVAGLVVAKCLLLVAAALALLRASDEIAGPRWRPLAALCVTLVVVAARHLVLARPVLLTLLFLALFVLVLERYLHNGKTYPLLLLIGVQVLWVNVQPLYLLGPALVACYAFAEGAAGPLRRLGVGDLSAEPPPQAPLLLALLAVCLVAVSGFNPYGIDGLLLPFKLLGRIEPGGMNPFTLGVSENIPPWALERQGQPGVAAFKWIAAIAFASFFLDLRRPVARHLLVLIAFFVLALMANRNVLLFYWLAAPIVAANVARWAASPRWSTTPAARVLRSPLAVTPLLVAGLLWSTVGLARQPSITAPAPFRVPTGTAAALGSLPQGSEVFNSVRYGGYLMWALPDQVRPYIDGRLVLRSPALFSRYLASLDSPVDFLGLAAEHDFAAALLPSAQPDRYLGLIGHLDRDPGWALTYTDGTEVLFVREAHLRGPPLDLASAAVVSEIVAGLEARYGSPELRERALVNLGRLLAQLGHYDRAEEVLVSREGSDARRVLARCYLLNGKLAAAQALAERLLAQDSEDAACLSLLALLASERGDRAGALVFARRALDADPFSVEARALLAPPVSEEAGATEAIP